MTQTRRPSNGHRPGVSRPGSSGLRFGMFAVCVTRDPDAGLNAGKAKPLYDLLVSYADVSSRDTSQGYPYREKLAASLDCSKQTVDRAADYLEKEIGLVKVHRRKVEGKPDENDANLYEIFDAWLIHGVTPPAGTPPQLVARYGHTIPGLDVDAWVSEHAPDFDLVAWQAAYGAKLRAQQAKREEQRRKERARRKKPKQGGGVIHDATPEESGEKGGSVTGDASGGVMGDALSRAGGPEPSIPDDEAPCGGVAPNGRRRPTTGSRDLSECGSAASGKNSPPSRSADTSSKGSHAPAKLTAEERKVRAAILELLPPDFREALGPVVPTNVGRAMIDALGVGTPRERTPRELVEHRFLPRWRGYWATRFYAGELTPELGGGKRKRPFGPLTQMLADTAECGNLWCEDRHDFVTETACTQCGMRKIDQRADRQPAMEKPAVSEPSSTVPRQAVAPMQCCDRCDRGFRSHTPGLCRDCQLESVST